ncbi:MAG: hypothetical protein QOE86_1807 [Solirubrobacteraceae bacterium]|nr:hypothetical protein [Solirubrobacteraceae bacterium]
MRRIAASALGLPAVIAALLAIAGAPARSADTYRVDAIFDTAKGVIPGQLVKIAGARVGTIDDVQLTRDYKARIVMLVPRKFAFRSDASCNIQPEGLISENFVQCDPGTPSKRPLERRGALPPTVPVQRTSVPVSLTDLFRIFQADVRQRFTVAVAAVGGGLAARGGDLNAILLRANPTLAAIRKLTGDLAAQKATLRRAVVDSDKVIASLAAERGDVKGFIDQAARVTTRTASRSTELADAIRRLPALLDATDPAVANLDRLTRDGRPLLGRLRAATPSLERLLGQVGPFAAAGTPALAQLGGVSKLGIEVARDARPVTSRLAPFSAAAIPAGAALASTLVDQRDRGFVENLNAFAYYGAAAQARYDATSHIFPAHPELTTCAGYATAPVAGCNAFYGGARTAAGTATARRKHPATRRPAPAATAAPVPSVKPRVPKLPKPVQDLADQLQQTLGKTLPPPLRDALGDPAPSQQTLNDLTDFLLGK